MALLQSAAAARTSQAWQDLLMVILLQLGNQPPALGNIVALLLFLIFHGQPDNLAELSSSALLRMILSPAMILL